MVAGGALFLDSERTRRLSDGRFALAAFRVDAVRWAAPFRGGGADGRALGGPRGLPPALADHEPRSYGRRVKRLAHEIAGPLALEHTSVTIDPIALARLRSASELQEPSVVTATDSSAYAYTVDPRLLFPG